MWRISSPGEYSLCSANSTDEPCSRARWSPVSAPSTITRALIGSEPSRASATGSSLRTRLPAHDRLAVVGRDHPEQAVDEVAGAHALGLGPVVEDEAVLQGR